VVLVGAGPGDVELLTLKAVRALGEADVVLLDDLVNREVLQFTRPGTRVIEVGKRGGCKSTPQAFIEKLMIRYASRGECVARVKGGDPFVFGRGGEECATLEAAGIPVEVMSGITAGVAAPASAGIPITHRDCTHGVTFITGHTRDGAPPDWRALAAGGTTLVIYMGIANIESIVHGLRSGGMAADIPAAVIENGTRPNQRVLTTTLANLDAHVREARIGSPAVVVLGEVARHARQAASIAFTEARTSRAA
jgi:uroporphyrin-III C-methyltransferase